MNSQEHLSFTSISFLFLELNSWPQIKNYINLLKLGFFQNNLWQTDMNILDWIERATNLAFIYIEMDQLTLEILQDLW